LDAATSGHDHLVPGEQGLMCQRIGEALVEIDHHRSYAALRRRYASFFRCQSELLTKRSLQAFPVEEFALDGRRLQSLVADELDPERVAFGRADMPEGAEELAGAQQELALRRL